MSQRNSETYISEVPVLALAVGEELRIKIAAYLPPTPRPDPLENILRVIAQCESGGNPHAKNPHSSAKGLLQIIDGTWQHFQCEGDVLDREDNWQCGMKIAKNSGLHHWDASRTCWAG